MENKKPIAVHKIVTETPVACKNCNSVNVVKFGKYKGVQRYWCKDCERKFKFDSGAFHGKVSAKYISQALAEFYTGDSVQDISNNLNQQYGYKPSKSVIWKWVVKYTNLAIKQFKDDKPDVGNVWVSDETMVDLDQNRKVWIYNVIDEKTRYLLASRVALSRTTKEAELVMKEAERRAGKSPTKVLTDSNYSYDGGISNAFGGDTEHVKTNPFAGKDKDNTERVERYHGTFKERVKVMRAFRDLETLIQFNDGWVAFYNYFKPHDSLQGKTPADEAGLKYQYRNWADLTKLPVSKPAEIQSHKEPKDKTPKPHTDLTKAFKRKRGPAPRGSVHLSKAEIKQRGFLSPVPPKITSRTPRITKQHYSIRGGGLTRRGDI